MTDNELHWLAGWLEGEGCFRVQRGKIGSLTFSVYGVSTDADVARRVAALLNVGVRERTPTGLGKKRLYTVKLHRIREIIPLFRALLPLMGQRRGEKIRALLSLYDNYKPLTPKECTDLARASKAARIRPQMEARARELEELVAAGMTWREAGAKFGMSDSGAQFCVYKYSKTYIRRQPAEQINRAKTHCIYGHPLTGENMVISMKRGRPTRVCRICRRRRAREYQRTRRAAL